MGNKAPFGLRLRRFSNASARRGTCLLCKVPGRGSGSPTGDYNPVPSGRRFSARISSWLLFVVFLRCWARWRKPNFRKRPSRRPGSCGSTDGLHDRRLREQSRRRGGIWRRVDSAVCGLGKFRRQPICGATRTTVTGGVSPPRGPGRQYRASGRGAEVLERRGKKLWIY